MFKVTKLSSNAQSLENILIHNKSDFNNKTEVYLRINDIVVYKSIADNSVGKGFIGMSGVVRNKLILDLVTDTVTVSEYKPKPQILKNMTIKIATFSKNKNIISLHEDEIKEKIKTAFCNHLFFNDQVLLLKINDRTFVLNINLFVDGNINKNTEIILFSDDVELNLIGSKLLKRDLFRDDYNFEEIGIGGLNKELIGVFRRALSTRAFKPSIAEKLGIKHVKGILLYGAPGCGKTLIARKLGSMITNREPKVVNGPEIMDKYVGQSEQNIRNLFSDAKTDYDNNKENSDLHVIIFDEIDAICKRRGSGGALGSVGDSVVNQLLSMIDGIHQLNNIFIIGMTNRKELLDEALLRAGRMEIHFEIGLADFEGRKQIFRVHTNKMQINSMMDPNVDIDVLAKLTDNYSGAEIETVVKNAGARALHEQLLSNKKEITESDIIVNMNHFLASIEEVVPSFGNINKTIKNLLPNKYVQLSKMHEICYVKTMEFIKKNRMIKTVLIYGENGTGKTTLATKIAFDNNAKHTKIIRAIDMVSFDELAKSQHISNIVTNAYISDDSMIVIDDVEIAINYANIGNVITFSNKIYQSFLTLLKTEPTTKSHKLTILVTCGDKNFFDVIAKYFDMTFIIGNMENKKNIIIELGGGENNVMINNDMTIKELLNCI
jgi:vesicle-fusing ATPase